VWGQIPLRVARLVLVLPLLLLLVVVVVVLGVLAPRWSVLEWWGGKTIFGGQRVW